MKYLKFLLYIACFVAPFGSAHLSVPLGGFQLSFIRVAIALVTLGLIVFTVKEKRKIVFAQKGNTYAVILMVVWFVYAAVSFFWCNDKSEWINHVYVVGFGCLGVFLFNNIIETKAEALKALEALHGGLFVQALIGLTEICTRNYYFVIMNEKELKNYNAGYRIPFGMANNQNNYALMMFFAFLIAFLLFSLAKNKKWKGFYLIAMLLEGSLLSLTYSRACLVGLYLAIALILMVNLVNRKWKIVILLLGACVLFRLVPDIVNSGTGSVGQTITPDLEGYDSIRVTLIMNGIHFLKDSFGLGIGAGQSAFWLGTRPYYDPDYMRALHNWWVEVFTEYGIVIFVGYMAMYIKVFWDNFKVIKSLDLDHPDKQFSVFICALMFGYILAAISPSSIALIEYIWIFWALIITFWRKDFLPRYTQNDFL